MKNQTFTVAMIGGDGAGKSTVAQRLLESFPQPIKYLYMGINIESSNVALPTSRLIEKLKNGKRNGSESGESHSSSLHNSPKTNKSKSKIWVTIRLLNRVAEEWYRQFLSWKYRKQGNIVLYDRHFIFDFARPAGEPESAYQQRPVNDRIHRWLLANCYPEPDLTIFLWAPPKVLFERKGEATLAFLDNIQRTFEKKGESVKNFVKIDTRQPLDDVVSEVNDVLIQFQTTKQSDIPFCYEPRKMDGILKTH